MLSTLLRKKRVREAMPPRAAAEVRQQKSRRQAPRRASGRHASCLSSAAPLFQVLRVPTFSAAPRRFCSADSAIFDRRAASVCCRHSAEALILFVCPTRRSAAFFMKNAMPRGEFARHFFSRPAPAP